MYYSRYCLEAHSLEYSGPLYLKRGSVRKPTILKSYVCVFVSMFVKAVYLELVTDLSTDSFIACLRRFISRRGKPFSVCSDHGTDFVGANMILKELYAFLLSIKQMKLSATSALLKELIGISYLSEHLILKAYGRPQ